jgi:hypothetical protein
MPNPNDGIIAAYANVASQALPSGYLGWSDNPDMLSPTAVVLTTAYGVLTRASVPLAGQTTYLDTVFTSAGTVTGAIWGLYSSLTAGPVAWTAESHTTVTGAAGLYSIPWVTPVFLTAGTYYVYQCVTGTTPSMPAVTATATGSIGATILNPNCSLASGTLNSAQLSSGAPTTISGTTTLTLGTGWALNASKLWYGIR